MSVKLKTENLKNGRKSLYLDIYINSNNFKRKGLKLYLEPEESPEDKERNEKVIRFAKKIRNEYEKKMLEERLEMSDPKEAYDYSFMVYFKKIVAERYESGICEETWRTTESHLKRFTKGELNFNQVNEFLLEGFKAYLLKKVSTNSAATYFNKLKHGIHRAYREKLLTSNPCFNVKGPKFIEPVRSYLTVDELRRMIEVKEVTYRARNAFLFSCFTGLRWSDVNDIKWGNIEENEKGIYINHRQKKTKSLELLPLNTQAIPFMGERKNDEDPVFPNLKYSAWENLKLNQWLLKAKVEKHITFHSARHTYATLLLNNDVNIFTVSKLLGHKDLKTTQIYAKLVDESKFKAVAKLPNVFE